MFVPLFGTIGELAIHILCHGADNTRRTRRDRLVIQLPETSLDEFL
jgi:hypothetical protein